MARNYFKGETIGMYVNSGTEEAPIWDLIACTETDGFSSSSDNIAIAAKCEGNFTANIPGDQSWEFSSTAYALLDTSIEANEVSRLAVAQIAKSQEIKQWKLANEDESYYVMGRGYISSFEDTTNKGEAVTFSITITGTGEYFLEPEVVV